MTKKFNEKLNEYNTVLNEAKGSIELKGPSGKAGKIKYDDKGSYIIIGEAELTNMGYTQLPPELTKLRGKPVKSIRTLRIGGNPLKDLSGLPSVVHTLNYGFAGKEGTLKSVKGSSGSEVKKLELYNTDVASLVGMPLVSTEIKLIDNDKLKRLNGLKVTKKLKSLPTLLDMYGGAEIQSKHLGTEDVIKKLEKMGVEFMSVRGDK